MARPDDQDAVRRLAMGVTDGLLESIDWFADAIAIRNLLIVEIQPIVDTFGDIAATLAAEYFEDITRRRATLAEPVAAAEIGQGVVGKLSTLFRKNQDIPAAINGVRGLVDSLTLGQGDRTIQASTVANNIRYAWVPEADACAHCRFKASRGPVYISREKAAAGITAGRHESCNCTAEPVGSAQDLRRLKSAGYDPAANRKLYDEAVANVGSTNQAKVLTEMDRLTGRTK